MAELAVGAGQQYSSIREAVAASRDGDVLKVQAGTYLNDFTEIGTRITLEAVGGPVHMQATTAPPNGKAILTTNADVTIRGFEFSGAAVPDSNGAGIRQQAGSLVVENSHFHDNQTGILTSAVMPDATLTIRNSEFARNSDGSGSTHNLYVGNIARLVVEDSYFHETEVGHNLKSRAQETVITGSRFADFESTGSYSIDLPNGGRATLADNVIEQGPNGQNPVMVSFGVEGNVHPGSSLEMAGNTVINDRPGGVMLWNATGTAATVTDTAVFGLPADRLVSGPATVTGTTFLDSEPTFDTSSPWQSAGTPPPSDPAPEPQPEAEPEPLPEPEMGEEPEPQPDLDPEPEPEAGEDPAPQPEPGPAPPAPPPESPPETGHQHGGGHAHGHHHGHHGGHARHGHHRHGDNHLHGTAGDDRMHGHRGEDTLEPGAGNDWMQGGPGGDTFVFGPGFGNDTIQGFTPHARSDARGDHLDLAALGVTDANFAAMVSITQEGGHAVIGIAGEGEITLIGRKAADLDTGDFILG